MRSPNTATVKMKTVFLFLALFAAATATFLGRTPYRRYPFDVNTYNTDTYNTDTYNTNTRNTDTYNTDTYNTDTYNTDTYNTDTYNTDTNFNTKNTDTTRYNTDNTRYNTDHTRYNTDNTRYNTYNTRYNTDNTRYNTDNTRYNTDNTRYNYDTRHYKNDYNRNNQRVVTKRFLTRNYDIIRLLNQVTSPNPNQDQVTIGRQYHIQNNVNNYNNQQVVEHFMRILRTSTLPRNKVFAVFNRRHLEEAVAFFRVLFYAKDFETFYKTACWARDHLNEGVFVYALTTAVVHRRDTRGMTLPPPSEVFPFYFFNTEVITKAQQLKQQQGVHEPKVAITEGIHQVGNHFVITSNNSKWFNQHNQENVLTYFTEDVDLNTFNYYRAITYPIWMNAQELSVNRYRRGEMVTFNRQQLLARYYLERLSHNMGKIPQFLWSNPIQTGFRSNLRHFNGVEMPSRTNNFVVYQEHNQQDLTTVRDYERRIREAIDTGFVRTETGATLSLRNPEDIERLANLIEGNPDSPNTRYYLRGIQVAYKLLGNGNDVTDNLTENPSVMTQYETALRDPMYYQLSNRIVQYFHRFKNNLRPYKREEVSFPGVRVQGVSVDRLVTYFEQVDTDISNAVGNTAQELNNNRQQFVVKARQVRLNHLPFNIRIRVNSDRTTDAVLRIFLGPKYDHTGRRINYNENRENFVELDKTLINLRNGMNTVTRNSRQFYHSVEDRPTTRKVMRNIQNLVKSNTEQFTVDIAHKTTGFPDRLVLPRGKTGGMEFQVYVVVTPLRRTNIFGSTNENRQTTTTTNENTNTYDDNIRTTFDDNALGYPLDRPVDTTTFWNPNMMLTDVTIYHKERTEDLDVNNVRENENYNDNTFDLDGGVTDNRNRNYDFYENQVNHNNEDTNDNTVRETLTNMINDQNRNPTDTLEMNNERYHTYENSDNKEYEMNTMRDDDVDDEYYNQRTNNYNTNRNRNYNDNDVNYNRDTTDVRDNDYNQDQYRNTENTDYNRNYDQRNTYTRDDNDYQNNEYTNNYRRFRDLDRNARARSYYTRMFGFPYTRFTRTTV